jgi:DNA polymerase-3 subunit alpha
MTPFVHLHVHSSYSLLDSTVRIHDLVDAAAAQEVKAVALTDHGVMHGALDFYKRCRERGVRPLIGCEMFVARDSHRTPRSEPQGNPNDHLVLLARTLEGYHNLARLNSIAHLDGFYHKPRIDKALLALHGKGLIGLSGCLQGEIGQHLAGDDMPGAVAVAGDYAEIFGKNGFYLEFMDHGLPREHKVNRALGDLSRKTGLPLVATNDVHYLRREDADAHERLLCLQTGMSYRDPLRLRYPSPEFYLKTGDEMARLCADYPDAVPRTLEVAEQCDVNLELGHRPGPAYSPPEGVTPLPFITRLCHEGLKRHYGVEDAGHPRTDLEKAAVERFRYELDVIEKTGFLDYVLVVWDYVAFARKRGIPVGPGRGSSGGCLIAYLLGITTIDPLRFNLVFERFLNPERVLPPEFAIDFCADRRGEVIDYVKRTYGPDRVARITTFELFNAKTAIRDVGRVLDMPVARAGQIAGMVPDGFRMTIRTALEASPALKAARNTDPACKRVLDYAMALEGVCRRADVNPAALAVAGQPLLDLVPLCRDRNGEPVTQYAADSIGECGLLRLPFPGLETLTALRRTVDKIQAAHSVALDLDRLPLDDEPALKLLSTGCTEGIPYLDSRGLQELIREVGLDTFENLIALIALFRPGPMAMLSEYVDRKTDKTPVTYAHPLLEPILRETYGVMAYQEQVLQAVCVLAGHTLGGADLMRRAVSRLRRDEMDRQRAAFITGCFTVNRIPPDPAERLFDHLVHDGMYSFSKAHATACALVAYQAAYLKAHYPAEYCSA